MAYDFPASPTEDQEYTPPGAGHTYVYKAPRWLVLGIPPTGEGGGGGGIDEAPVDGKQYGRTSAAWTEVIANPTWTTLSGKPATFPPTVPIPWTDISGKPATFPPTLPIAQADVTGLVAGQTAQDTAIGTKLDSASYTAADVLTKVKTVDGTGSGLDADLLDGQEGSYYLSLTNATGTLPAARFDDTAHGTRAGGTLHAAVTTSVNGFMIAADKTKLDGVATGAGVAVPPATVAPLMDGAAVVGTTTKYAREDHVHPTDTSRAATSHTHAQADVTNLVTDLAGKVSDTGDTMTGPLVLPSGTAAATTLNFGTAGSGLYFASSAVNVSISGASKLAVGPTLTTVATLARVIDGTAAAPSWSFTNSTGMGLWRVGADQLGFATGGTNRLTLTSTAFTSTLPVELPADPTVALQAATKQYVDAVAAGGGGGASVTIADTAPGGASVGDMWWESDSGALHVFFDSAWIQVASATSTGTLGTAATKNIHVASSAPSSPATNDLWVDTT